MQRRLLATSMLLILGALSVSAVQRLDGRPTPPGRLPEALRGDSSAALSQIHVFVRPQCAHCQHHLENLEVALRQLTPSIQDSLRPRIHLWALEETVDSVPGLRSLPLSRHALGVRWTPTSWFVSAPDSIADTWLGARNTVAWRRWLQRLRRTPGGVL